MRRVATYSRACLEELRRDTGIAYEERCRGTLQMFRDQKGLDDAAKDIEILTDFGVAHSLLDRAGCIVQEPALKTVHDKVAGSLLLPCAENGDRLTFTHERKKRG